MILRLVPLAIFLVLAGFLAKGLTLDSSTIPSALMDKPAPEFSLPILGDSNTVISGAQLTGAPYVLNVFASWCVSCVTEHPHLVKLAEENSDILLVGLNYKDQSDEAQGWLNRFGNPFELVLEDNEGRVGIDWGVVAVPETFVVDGAGVVRFKHTGPLDQTIIDTEIKPLLVRLSAPG
ncbi:MAG: DsbE family thiol:disulfide interchange protein [Gammaproteobacteria bacterium]|nr:DsbE family thiol:disulfide interchange protein [Gammaproteobacteria bacterium]